MPLVEVFEQLVARAEDQVASRAGEVRRRGGDRDGGGVVGSGGDGGGGVGERVARGRWQPRCCYWLCDGSRGRAAGIGVGGGVEGDIRAVGGGVGGARGRDGDEGGDWGCVRRRATRVRRTVRGIVRRGKAGDGRGRGPYSLRDTLMLSPRRNCWCRGRPATTRPGHPSRRRRSWHGRRRPGAPVGSGWAPRSLIVAAAST